MAKTREELEKQLDEKIPSSAVRERDGGGGRKLSYLEGHYVIDRLNKVFGPGMWAFGITKLSLVHTGTTQNSYKQDVHSVHYIAEAMLTVKFPDGEQANYVDVGYGDGSDKVNIGKAYELAVKEATTDALKRCARNLGMSMGLALYDKTKANVEEEVSEIVPAAIACQPVVTKSNRDDQRKKQIAALTEASKTVLSLGKRSLEQLKDELSKRYKINSKEDLTYEQANEFTNYLKAVAEGKSV